MSLKVLAAKFINKQNMIDNLGHLQKQSYLSETWQMAKEIYKLNHL